MLLAIWEVVSTYLAWGALVGLPVAIFGVAASYGMNFRQAGMLAAIGFALMMGWNARGVVDRAGDNAALRAAMERAERFEARANELASEVEAERAEIRESVDDAIWQIQRAAAEARSARGVCELTDDELDGLRRAWGIEDDPRAPGKSDH